jgi:HK97 family phage portal protein
VLDALRRLFRVPNERASATTRLDVQTVTGANAVWTPSNYDALSREGYEHSTYVFACINQLARQTAYVRPLLYQTDRRGRMTEIDDHPILQLISRPNEDQALEQFLEAAYITRLLSGNTYLERVGLENRPPVELYVKRPDRMRVLPGRDTRISGYEYRIAGLTYKFDAWQILHLRTYHPRDDYYGLSPLAAAARGVDVFNAGQAHNLAMLQNGARPTGAWVSSSTLTDDQFENLRAQLDEASGLGNRGRPLLLEGGIDWKELGLNPRDLDFLAGQADAARQIHAVYGVHPVLTGLQTGTYDNQREASRALLNMAVFPFLDMLFGELTRWIGPLYGTGFRLTFDRNAFPAFSEDEGALVDRASNAFKAGVLSRNEARAMLGYEPTPDGDVFNLAPTSGGAPVVMNDAPELQTRQDSYTPTEAMRTEAARGLEWRAEYGRGGTAVGVARARDITNGRDLPIDTVRRMNSYFARHEVDKEADGFRPGEPGFPSAGRIAWALWGGDPGQRWARAIVERADKEDERASEPPPRGLDTRNEREVELYRQTRVLLQDVWIERLTRAAEQEFETERRALARAFKNAPEDANAAIIAEQVLRANTFPDLTATWLAAAVAGGQHTLDTIETEEQRQQRQELPSYALLARVFGLTFDASIQYAREHSSKLIVQISDSTMRDVQERITRGVLEGMKIPSIAELIDELYLNQIIPNRSRVIARTETIRATNYGAGAAARGTGLDLVKGWLATTDGFAREGHVEAMNRYRTNPIPIDSAFEVAPEPGGTYDNLDYPGDPRGAPENTIQCRCAPFYRERRRAGRPQ